MVFAGMCIPVFALSDVELGNPCVKLWNGNGAQNWKISHSFLVIEIVFPLFRFIGIL